MILLLKPNDIPRLTSLSGNIDIDKLNPHIFTSQVNDVKRILGLDLYNKMFESNLTDEYAIIYNDYLLYLLAYYSVYYYMGVGSYQIEYKGIVKLAVEGGKAVDMKEAN